MLFSPLRKSHAPTDTPKNEANKVSRVRLQKEKVVEINIPIGASMSGTDRFIIEDIAVIEFYVYTRGAFDTFTGIKGPVNSTSVVKP